MPALIQADDGTIWDAETQPNPDVLGNNSRNSFLWNCYHHKLGQFFQTHVKNAILRAINAVYSKNEYSFDGEYLVLQNALCESIKTRINEDPERKQPFMLKIADLLVYVAQDDSRIKRLEKTKLFKTSVDFAYRGIKRYDSEAFVYDDNRLQEISGVLKNEICVYWQDDCTLQKVAEIIVFLMKEDIYYRPRFIQILQDVGPVVGTIRLKTDSILLVGLCKLCHVCKDFELTDIEKANVERWH